MILTYWKNSFLTFLTLKVTSVIHDIFTFPYRFIFHSVGLCLVFKIRTGDRYFIPLRLFNYKSVI